MNYKHLKTYENYNKSGTLYKDQEILFLNTTDKDGKFYPTECIDLNKLNENILTGSFGDYKEKESFQAFNFNIRNDILYADILCKSAILKTMIEDYDVVFRGVGSISTYKKFNKDFVSLFSITSIKAILKENDNLTGQMNYYDAKK